MAIYQRPATRFVAGFVGAPRINLLPVELAAGAGGFVQARLANGAIVHTRVRIDALPTGGSFEIGLRPDAVMLTAPGEGDADASVELVERLGDRTHVYAQSQGSVKVVSESTRASVLRAGDRIGLKFEGGAAHLFDADDRAYHAAVA